MKSKLLDPTKLPIIAKVCIVFLEAILGEGDVKRTVQEIAMADRTIALRRNVSSFCQKTPSGCSSKISQSAEGKLRLILRELS